MAIFHQVKSYAAYWLLNVDEHALHSPFFYDFYTQVVSRKPEALPLAEKLRADLLKSTHLIEMTELGAGSVLNSAKRKVSDVARVSLSSSKFSSLYARAINFFQCKNVVELGTSLGINTLYLAQNKNSKVTSFEGVPAIAEIAKDTFGFAAATNIHIIEGNIDTTLPTYLRNSNKLDFAFIDANHRYTAAMHYFENLLEAAHNKTILVFDDIHLNAEMEKAWKEIRQHELVYATADLYRCGFVFLDPSLNRQHRILRF